MFIRNAYCTDKKFQAVLRCDFSYGNRYQSKGIMIWSRHAQIDIHPIQWVIDCLVHWRLTSGNRNRESRQWKFGHDAAYYSFIGEQQKLLSADILLLLTSDKSGWRDIQTSMKCLEYYNLTPPAYQFPWGASSKTTIMSFFCSFHILTTSSVIVSANRSFSVCVLPLYIATVTIGI